MLRNPGAEPKVIRFQKGGKHYHLDSFLRWAVVVGDEDNEADDAGYGHLHEDLEGALVKALQAMEITPSPRVKRTKGDLTVTPKVFTQADVDSLLAKEKQNQQHAKKQGGLCERKA